MKRFTQVWAIVCVLGLGMGVVAWGQADTDIVEKMNVTRILRAEVLPVSESGPHFMYVTVELKNDNDKDLKLTKASFDFYINAKEPDQEDYIGPAACIYDPIPPVLGCAGTKDDILLPANTPAKQVMFVIDLENPEFETTIRILNFLGTHSANQYFFIKGRFDLGIKSDRGWTYAEALRVEWMFCPEQRDDLPLDACFVE